MAESYHSGDTGSRGMSFKSGQSNGSWAQEQPEKIEFLDESSDLFIYDPVQAKVVDDK